MTAAQLLPWTLGVPLLGVAGIVGLRRWPALREGATLASAVALFALVLAVVRGWRAGEPSSALLFEFLPGLSLALHVEPLSALFALVASGLWGVTAVYSMGYLRSARSAHATRFHACFALALAGTMGVAFAANLLTLFISYEVLTLSTFPLVTHHGNERARQGGRTYLGILLTTSIALLLPAVLWVYADARSLDFRPGGILSHELSGAAGTVLLALFLFGTAKAALMPVHRWLPAAMVAPTPVSALLHAVAVVKAGVFTVLKVALYVFGTEHLAALPWQPLALYAAGFTVVAASLVALRQTNLKRLLAYSTIGQLGYVVMAAMTLAPAAHTGAALHIAAHAFGKITLFFTAGAIYIAAHKTDTTQFDGLGRRMPWTMAAFAVGALSMIGVPPTAGFVSKWYIALGAFEAGQPFVLAVLVLSTGLSAAYFLPLVYRAWFVPERVAPEHEHGEAPWPMVVALAGTAALTLGMFVWHAPVLALARAVGGVAP